MNGNPLAIALSWVLQEAVELSCERVPGLQADEAEAEIADLLALCQLARFLGADDTAIDGLIRSLAEVKSEYIK